MLALGEQIAEHAAHLDAALHRLLRDIHAFDQGAGWCDQGARSCAQWLSWRIGWGPGTARERVRVANKLAELPLIDDALRCGRLSYCKVRAITRVATAQNESTLLLFAEQTTGAQLEKICRKYSNVVRDPRPDDDERRSVRCIDLADGMTKFEAVMHPEDAALLMAAVERIAAERCRDVPAGTRPASPSRPDALVAMAEDVVRGTRRERSPTEIVVSVSAETLYQPDADPTSVGETPDGTCLAPATVRRLACDCCVVNVVEDERGIPLSVGRRRRTLPPALKAALLRRDKTCRFPGCRARVFLQGHHLEHWVDGGKTSLDNALCLCGFHHRYVHEYNYTVEIDGIDAIFKDPFGRIVPANPRLPAPPNCGRATIVERNIDLDISAETPFLGWDGSPIDYGLAIDGLVTVDDT